MFLLYNQPNRNKIGHNYKKDLNIKGNFGYFAQKGSQQYTYMLYSM